MLSLFDGSTMLTLFSKSLVVLRPMNYNIWLKRGLSLMTISVIQSPSLLYVLLKAKTSLLRYIGYLKFIKELTKHGLLQIQALVPPLNFLNY